MLGLIQVTSTQSTVFSTETKRTNKGAHFAVFVPLYFLGGKMKNCLNDKIKARKKLKKAFAKMRKYKTPVIKVGMEYKDAF